MLMVQNLMSRLPILLPFAAVALAFFGLRGPLPERTPVPLVAWTMLAVNDATPQQADAHLLRTGGATLLIDAGAVGGPLVALLKKYGVKRIDIVLISHPHKDHYGGLWALFDSDVSVGRVVMNFPSKKSCDVELPWGCDYADLEKLGALMVAKGISHEKSSTGDLLFREGLVTLQTLYAHDGASPPVGVTDINDQSLIVRLQAGPHRALFTGDLNDVLGRYLAQHVPDLEADILKVPHHGTEGVAPNEFFARVAASLALVPAPTTLWHSDRSKRIRDYFAQAAVPAMVSGELGDVTVEFLPREWRIRTERAIP